MRLDPQTMKPVTAETLYPIAAKPSNTAVEAPFIIEGDGYYYLFVSHDFCCTGVNSINLIVVGRAEEITGPYVDREGIPMMA